jgi:small subunit ribosomal protein S1
VSTDPQNAKDNALDKDLEQEVESALADLNPAEIEAAASQAPVEQRASTPHHGGGNPHDGESSRIQGRIVGIRERDVYVDYGGKSEGFVPLDEFEADSPPEVGQIFTFIPHGFDRDSGQMRLSLREVKIDADWESLKVGDTVEARVTGTNIGGLELTIHGLRAFMPKSQVDIVRHEDFRGFVGKRLECQVTEIDRRGKNILVSRRKVLEREQEKLRAEAKEGLEVGQVKAGKVQRLTDFGAFVDIGGIEGLLHVSDISYARINHPKEVLKPGQEVEVQITKLDLARDRISLGMKQLKQDPWQLVEGNYRPGNTVEGKIVKLMDFGAFVALEEGVEGLIPISEMSWTQRVNHPKDILKVGDMARVQVLNVDSKKRRISLSLKAMSEDPWASVQDRYAPDTVVKGAVTRITNFGAFVQLEEGIEGLVHISELSDQHVRSVGDVVKEGELIECKVLGLDMKQRRISLSVKATKESSQAEMEMMPDLQDRKQSRKKKRPQRGGLSW